MVPTAEDLPRQLALDMGHPWIYDDEVSNIADLNGIDAGTLVPKLKTASCPCQLRAFKVDILRSDGEELGVGVLNRLMFDNASTMDLHCSVKTRQFRKAGLNRAASHGRLVFGRASNAGPRMRRLACRRKRLDDAATARSCFKSVCGGLSPRERHAMELVPPSAAPCTASRMASQAKSRSKSVPRSESQHV